MYDFQKFISDNKDLVLRVCKGTGFFPSVMMGQIDLEASADLSKSTGYGYHKLSYLAHQYKNYNGIKYRDWMLAHGVAASSPLNTVEHTPSGQVVTIKPRWASFRSLEHNLTFKIIMLKRVAVYKRNKVFEASTPREQLERLWDNGKGYATDRQYVQKVMSRITQNNLLVLDEELKKKIMFETSLKALPPSSSDRFNRILNNFFRMKNILTPIDSVGVQ